jgi:hypothetical protein
MSATSTSSLADLLVGLARALELTLGPGRSAAVWSLDPSIHLRHLGSQAPPALVRAAEARLEREAISFEVQGGPGACGSVHVCSLDEDRAAFGLFVDGGEPHLEVAIDRLIDLAEQGMEKRVEDMSRTEKQEVVRFLDERGAFLIRRAVADVAARLGVTRFTIYNYLDREA